jgi:hypothetical protein
VRALLGAPARWGRTESPTRHWMRGPSLTRTSVEAGMFDMLAVLDISRSVDG